MLEENSLLVNIISLRMRHHAKSSGYDRLCDYVDANVISSIDDWTLGKRIVTRLLRFAIGRSCQQWYHRDSLYSELRAATQWLRRSGQVFHYLYGENSYRYLGGMKSFYHRNYIVCSYHTPPDKFKNVVRSVRHLKYLNAVIVVSTIQQEYFSSLVGNERVFYVPHGIDVNYYRPSDNEIKNKKANEVCCLFVGSHLRDLETLVSVMKRLEGVQKNIIFKIVTKKDNWKYFSESKNAILLANLKSDDLLDLYQSSDIFVMPLQDCTANNSLLEAMACGMPIVSTDLAGVRDYVNDDCALLAPKSDVKKLVDIIDGLASDIKKRLVMAKASRKQSLVFRWEKVADEVKDVYRTVQ